MKRHYAAANLQEAHLLLGLLEQEGIRARVLNENAQGGVGELPFTQTYPEIWLEDERDFSRAASIIQRYERASARTGAITCPQCGEENPETFEVCWRCGELLK